MNLSELVDGQDVLPLDPGWHARNRTAQARSADKVQAMKRFCSGWYKPQPDSGWALVRYRLLGQRGPDHLALTSMDNICTRTELEKLYGRTVVWMERQT